MSNKSGQNYANHKQMVPMYHYVLFFLVFITLIGAFVNLGRTVQLHSGRIPAALIASLSLSAFIALFLMRIFALKAQDRAIRAEENFRHYLLTGKPLDSKLRMGQIIALRFASDEEFAALAAKASKEDIQPKDIKKAIKNWKGDYNRA